MVTPNLSPTPSLTRLGKTTTRHTPLLGESREIEPVGMKLRGIEAARLEVEEIEAEAKETKLATVTQTQLGLLSTIWDILEAFFTVGDTKMNTLVTSQKHRSQVREVNLNMSLGNTSGLGECNP